MKRFLWILAAATAVGALTCYDLTADEVAPTAPADERGVMMTGAGTNSDAGVTGRVRLHNEPDYAPAAGPAPGPLPEAKRQVIIQALVLQIDWQQLEKANIELPALVGRGGESNVSLPHPLPLVARAVESAHADQIVSRLLDSGAATMLSRPQITTLDGRPAQMQIGAEMPVAIFQEIVNGKSRQRVESRTTGQAISLKPTVLDDDQLLLAIDVESSRLLPTPRGGGKQPPLTIQSRAFNLQMMVAEGEAAVLAELPPEAQPAADPDQAEAAEAEHGLVLVFVPRVLERTVGPPVPLIYPRPIKPPVPLIYPHPVEAAARQVSPPQPLELAAAARRTSRWPARIELCEGDVRVLRTGRPQNVDGFDPGILDVRTTDDDLGLRLQAKEKGVTSLLLDFGYQKPVRIDVFVTGDTRQLEAHLERLYPDTDIRISEVGDSVVLRGSATAQQIRGIVEVAEQFYPRVLNQLESAQQAQQPAARIAWATAANDRVAVMGRRLGHLRQAAANLKSAGLDEIAGKITAQAQDVERELARITQPRTPAASADSSTDLRREIRELRGEVQELRRDVGRLIELLEKDPEGGAAASAGAADDADRDHAALPPQAAGDLATLSKFYGINFDLPGFEFVLPVGARRSAANLQFAHLKIAQATELCDQRRYAEAERAALEAYRIAPAHPAAGKLYFRIRTQRELADKAPPKPELLGIEPDRGAEAKIRRRLDQPISLSFDKTPLADALKKLAGVAEINVALDNRGLEEEGVSSAAEVSLHVDQVSLQSALKLLLEPLGLGYRVENEVLKVTSRTRAAGRLEVRNYSLGDLAGSDSEPGVKAARLSAFADLIAAVIEPDSWSEKGGVGSVRPFEKTASLVIRQSEDVHEKVADLLGQLRRLKLAEPADRP